jgi:hypothetical protein
MTTRSAAVLTGVSRATATRAKATARPTDPAPRSVVPANKLSLAERTRVLEVLNCEEFVDLPPLQVYATLLERGEYLCSVATMYRILAEHSQVKERRRLARHPARVVPEMVATGPGQVYSWGITKLDGPAKGVYYDAYVMIDIYSRYIVGAHVHAHESGVLAEELMKQIFGIHGIHGIPAVVHADRGTSMTSKSVATLLADLGVTRSHTRPSVSNDNPYSRLDVQDHEVHPGVPRQVRIPGRRSRVHGPFRRRLQPRAPSHRDRTAHPRRRPLRPAPCGLPDTISGSGCGTSGSSRAFHHRPRPQDPGAPSRRMDQPNQPKPRPPDNHWPQTP